MPSAARRLKLPIKETGMATTRNDRRAPALQEDIDDANYQCYGDQDRGLNFFDRPADEGRRIVDVDVLNIRGKLFLKFIELREDFVLDLNHVRSRHSKSPEGVRWIAIRIRNAVVVGRSEFNAANISNASDATLVV